MSWIKTGSERKIMQTGGSLRKSDWEHAGQKHGGGVRSYRRGVQRDTSG